MSFEEFLGSIPQGKPPAVSPALLGLWHDRAGDWDRAHESAQADATPAGAWVHAYLHRKEGDLGNAQYWYQRARRPASIASLGAEWEAIARALLAG